MATECRARNSPSNIFFPVCSLQSCEIIQVTSPRVVLAGLFGLLFGFVIYVLVFCQPMTILAQGTVLSIPSHNHLQYGFTEPSSLSSHATYGGFTANNGVTLYVMSASQFNNFISTGNPSSFIYTTGQVFSASLSTGLRVPSSHLYLHGAGQHYFVFYNSGDSTTNVTITMALSVETCQIPP